MKTRQATEGAVTGGTWRTVSPVLVPDRSVWWMGGYAGAATVADPGPQSGESEVEILVSGRDHRNRSHIGQVWIDPDDVGRPARIAPEPVLAPGTTGCFDDSGVSYPCVVDAGPERAMLFTGWNQRVSTPFQNDLGLALRSSDGHYRRVSRAPILPLDDADHLSIGSSFALIENGVWRLWYTSWSEWGSGARDAPHHYAIKYATSPDGRTWTRPNLTCIGPAHPDEHSICRPSVLRRDDGYHMWFCSRGDRYQIGYAWSADGVEWIRAEEPVAFTSSTPGFDDEERAYPHVFTYRNRLLMLFSGNGYGQAGLGLAELDQVDELGGKQ